MSQRLLRVRELLKRELSNVIAKDFEFPNVLVTVTDVDVTPDLRSGHVFIGIVGPEEERDKVIAKLNENHGLIQSHMSRRVVLKYTPQLTFRPDVSAERGVRVVSLLQEIEDTLPPDEDMEEGYETGDHLEEGESTR